MQNNKIEINSKLLVILVVLLVVCVMAIAFLLGRESAMTPHKAEFSGQHNINAIQGKKSETDNYSNTQAISQVQPDAANRAISDNPVQISVPAEKTASNDSPTAEAKVLPKFKSTTINLEALQSQSAGKNNNQEVARYFSELDEIANSAKYWDDPNSMAQEVLKGAMGGDTSGIDRLTSSYRAVKEKLSTINVPNVCSEHYRATIDAFNQSISILETIKSGISSGDVSKLTSLSSEAENVKQKSADLERITKELKSRYGIK